MSTPLFPLVSFVAMLLLAAAHMQEVVPIAAPISVGLFAVVHAVECRWPKRPVLPVVFALMFICYAMFLLLLHNVLRDYSIMEVIRLNSRMVYVLAIFLIFAHLRPTAQIEKGLFRAVLYSAAIIGLFSMISRFGSTITIGDNQLSSQRSLLGLLGNHNAMAALLGSVLVISAVTSLHQFQYPHHRFVGPLSFIAIGLVAMAFACTLSRSYTLALAVTGVVFSARIPFARLRQLALTGGIIAAVAAVTFVWLSRSRTSDFDNVRSRMALYQRAVETLNQSPILGMGPGAFEEWHVSYHRLIPHVLAIRQSGVRATRKNYQDVHGAGGVHAHNWYLQFLCDFGMLGFGMVGGLFWTSYRRHQQLASLREEAARQGLNEMWERANWNGSVALFMMLFLAIASCFSGYTFTSPPWTLVFYACLGRLASQSGALLEVLDWSPSFEGQTRIGAVCT